MKRIASYFRGIIRQVPLSSALLAKNIALSGMYWMSFPPEAIHVFKNQSQTEVCVS